MPELLEQFMAELRTDLPGADSNGDTVGVRWVVQRAYAGAVGAGTVPEGR